MTSIVSHHPAVLQGLKGPIPATIQINPSNIRVFTSSDNHDYTEQGTLDYSIDTFKDGTTAAPCLKIDYVSRTSPRPSFGKASQDITNIGTVLIEALHAKAFVWNVKVGNTTYPSNDRIQLFSVKRAIFFYWRLGFRPHPNHNISVHPEFETIWEKLQKKQHLSPKEELLYDMRKALLAKEREIPESFLAHEDVCKINLTEEIENLYEDAQKERNRKTLGTRLKAISHKIPCLYGGVMMYLPTEGQNYWKRRILFQPNMAHDKELLDKLLFEVIVLDAPSKVTAIVKDYLLG